MTRPDVEVMRDLLAQVKRTISPDDRIDQMLFAMAYGWSYPLHGAAWSEYQGLYHLGRFTGSIDAALTLVKLRMPDAEWSIKPDHCWIQYPTAEDVQEAQGGFTGGGGKRTALAIITALLSALIAAEGRDHG